MLCYRANMLLTGIYVQLLVLGLTFLWFASCKRRSNLDLMFKALSVSTLLLGLWLASVWVYPPYWGLGLMAFVFAILALWKLKKDPTETEGWRRSLSNIPAVLVLILGGYMGLKGISGHGQNPDGLVVELNSPFGPKDKACVLSGGLNSLLNQHNFESDKPEDQAEIYGLDVMGFNRAGFRVRSGYQLNPKPKDLEAYMAYGMELRAPCTGQVLEAVDDQPDQAIGTKIRVQSNQLLMVCDDVKIWMGHLLKDSVKVTGGEQVTAGTLIGKIGNSGHTEEPHLHIHAETIEPGREHGKPVHMRFDGKYMARGDCF